MKNPYVKIWLLISLALAVFIVISFCESPSIGNYSLKQGSFAEMLLKSESDISKADSIDALQLMNSLDNNKQERDTTTKSILIFGDSMTYNLALRLSQYARQNGHIFHGVNWDSSSTKIWADSDTLQYFIDKYNVDYIFIVLGSNELYFKDPNYRTPQVKKILEKIGDIPYIWIGPPNWKEDTGFNNMLAKTCAPGSFFLTDRMELKRRKDHIHPTQDASKIWMDSIVRWMPKSKHPIRMEIPADSIRPQKKDIIFLKALNK